jgi:hypothetical protein
MSAYSLIGGLMIGSSVYHLLAFNGNILGVAGIYGSQVSRLLNAVRSVLDVKRIPKKTSNGSNNVANEGEPSTATANEHIEDWRFAFIAGLVFGGMILRVFCFDIERRLGVPIFEDSFIAGKHPLETFLVGGLVGAGTKVNLKLARLTIDCGRMYFRSHAMWCLSTLCPFICCNSNVFLNSSCDSHSLPSSARCYCFIYNNYIQPSHSSTSSNPSPPISIYHPVHRPVQVVQIRVVILHCCSLRIRSFSSRDAPTQ